MEDCITIRNLKHNNSKLGTKEVARLADVGRNIIKLALASDDLLNIKRRKDKSYNPAI